MDNLEVSCFFSMPNWRIQNYNQIQKNLDAEQSNGDPWKTIVAADPFKSRKLEKVVVVVVVEAFKRRLHGGQSWDI